MSTQNIQIRELAAWGFDDPVDRGLLLPEELPSAVCRARRRLERRESHRRESPISIECSRRLARELAARKQGIRSSGEFDGLTWVLAVVDLRKLIAFQRRIGFGDDDHLEIEPAAGWQQLLEVALPIHPHSKSPYMEIASYRGRWFLRDGYHRSFRILKRGISLVPAVVVYAETLAQLGAIGSQFFAEEILFSRSPPLLADFLDDQMVLRYLRPQREIVAPPLHEPVEASCWNREEI